jgi:hypothetical protein
MAAARRIGRIARRGAAGRTLLEVIGSTVETKLKEGSFAFETQNEGTARHNTVLVGASRSCLVPAAAHLVNLDVGGARILRREQVYACEALEVGRLRVGHVVGRLQRRARKVLGRGPQKMQAGPCIPVGIQR